MNKFSYDCLPTRPLCLFLVVSGNAATAVERPPTNGMGMRGWQGAPEVSGMQTRPRPKYSKTPVASSWRDDVTAWRNKRYGWRNDVSLTSKSQVFGSKPLFGGRICPVHSAIFALD